MLTDPRDVVRHAHRVTYKNGRSVICRQSPVNCLQHLRRSTCRGEIFLSSQFAHNACIFSRASRAAERDSSSQDAVCLYVCVCLEFFFRPTPISKLV